MSSISVVIPTHNRRDNLLLALESVYRQTILPSEVIVVDDGSCPLLDGSIFCNSPSGLSCRLITHHVPQGAAKARNTGIENAIGHWIAFLDDDDRFRVDKIEKITRVIESIDGVDLIYHPALIEIVDFRLVYKSRSKQIESGDNGFKSLLVKNIVGGTSMVTARKQCLVEAGLFKADFVPREDHELWIRMFANGKVFYFIDEPLTYYYHHSAVQSLTKNIEKQELSIRKIEKSYADEYAKLESGVLKKYKGNLQREKVYICLLNRQLWSALKYQILTFLFTLKILDLFLCIAILFGTKTVFKLRSIV